MGRAKGTTRLLAGEPQDLGRPFVCRDDESDRGADDALDAAIARGYQEGLTRAQAELAAEVEAFREEVRASLQRISEYEKTFAVQHEARILELTLAVASRIVRERIDAGDELAARALQEALQALPDSTRVKVRLHADDVAPVLDRHRADVDAGRIEIVADDSLSRGGAILESDFGRVDATVETAERHALKAVLGSGETR